MSFKCVDCNKKVTPQSDITGMTCLSGKDITIPYQVCDKCHSKRVQRFPDVYWRSCHMNPIQQFERTLNDMGYGNLELTKDKLEVG